MTTNFKQDNPGCGDDDCCECTDPPSCTLTGTCSGEDTTLTWTVSGVGITSAKITDNRGNEWVLTVPPDSGTLTITGGCCYKYRLTVINDCGSSFCEWAYSLSLYCKCANCTYEVSGTTIEQRFPAGLCIPCGCARGEGDLITATVSGIPSLMSTQRICIVDNSFLCPFPTYPSLGTSYNYYCWDEFDGFDILNGTYLFTLSSINCLECGTLIGCMIDPGYYLIGTAHAKYYSVTDPACRSGTPSLTTDHTIQLAIGFQAPGATPVTTGPALDCRGFPNFSYRDSSSTTANRVCPYIYWRRTAPTTTSWDVMKVNDWTVQPDLSGIGMPADSCGVKFIGQASGVVGVGTCCKTTLPIYGSLMNSFGDGRTAWVGSYGSIETAVNTIGY